MKIEQKFIDRFTELIERGEEIRKSYRGYQDESYSFDFTSAVQWKVNCLSFLTKVFGDENIYFRQFEGHFRINDQSSIASFGEVVSVVKAAKEDYENGYLFDTRTLIEAEVFNDFLEQAQELFKKGYYQPAAVIAGGVLEDGLRKLCNRNSIALPAKATIDPMNVELAKAGIYTKLIQKKITALADLRNKAAHGEWTEFTEKDVEDMIRNVRRFMEDYFS